MGKTNLYLVGKCHQLEALEREVSTRIQRAKDKDDAGSLDSDLFRIKNPDIKQPMAEWLADRTDELVVLRSDVEAILSRNDQLSDLRMKLVTSAIEFGASRKELAIWLARALE